MKYEDEEDGQGNVVMYYLVLVEDRFRHVKPYTLHKRYSDFLQLKEMIHEKSVDMDAFRFPNKSIFNNRSRYDVTPSFSYFLFHSTLFCNASSSSRNVL